MTLKEIIENFKKERLSQIPDDVKAIMMKATEDLINSGIEEQLPKVGEKIFDFTLPNYDGKEVRLGELLENGPVVLNFYRGGWCPYCNLQLNYLQSRLDDFKKYGAVLVAVSPELPDMAASTVDRHSIKFYVLSDVDNKVAKKLGLVFKLPDEVVSIYKKLGHDLEKYNGNDKYEIPIPATFVIDKDFTIRYSFGKADYTQRAEPDDIIEVLKTLQ